MQSRRTRPMRRIWRFIPLITAAVFATPSFLLAQEPKLPADLKKVAVADGVELHYVEKSKGVPVVFVHGGGGDCSAARSAGADRGQRGNAAGIAELTRDCA